MEPKAEPEREKNDSPPADGCRVVLHVDSGHAEFTDHDDSTKGAPKRKKHLKIVQEKKSMTINVDLLKAAFFALGQFGPEEEEDERQLEISLSFSDLSYSVKRGMKREAKHVLNELHGEFQSGELTAIVGPSGCGKSSLLNILTGFTTAGVTGSITINGEERDLAAFGRRSCYIMQNDELSPLLTAEEAMTMAAHLKLGPRVAGKKNTASKILESLGLLDCSRALVKELSGGQRKRLAIALELISNPPVMFLDEPTSGLDSSSSKQCISLLKDLAKSGRTVVCSLHQPSASLFEMFDHLYVMRDGSCLYSGDAEKLLPFLADHGLECPRHYNPADFVLEVATMAEYGREVPGLVDKIENGKCRRWRKTVPGSERSRRPEKTGEAPSSDAEDAASTLIPLRPGARRSRIAQHPYPAPFWTQFCVISVNSFRKIYRNLFFTHLQLAVHVLCGVFIGLLFYDIGDDAAFLFDNFGFQFFCLMWNMFTSYSSAVSYYPLERPILAREHFNKWYSLRAYFFATNLANLPVQIVCAVLFTTISYFLTSQPNETDRFLKFTLITLLVALVGQGFGYLVGSAMNVQNATIFGALLIAPFLLFSGYFVLLVDSPGCLKWLFHLSYYKYALEGAMDAVFGNDREKMKCSEDYCHYKSPRTFLKQLGMDRVDYWLDFSVLLGLSIVLRVLSYFILRFRLNYCRY